MSAAGGNEWDVQPYFQQYCYTPGNLTWKLRIHHWKRRIIFQTIIFSFYLIFWAVVIKPVSTSRVAFGRSPSTYSRTIIIWFDLLMVEPPIRKLCSSQIESLPQFSGWNCHKMKPPNYLDHSSYQISTLRPSTSLSPEAYKPSCFGEDLQGPKFSLPGPFHTEQGPPTGTQSRSTTLIQRVYLGYGQGNQSQKPPGWHYILSGESILGCSWYLVNGL